MIVVALWLAAPVLMWLQAHDAATRIAPAEVQMDRVQLVEWVEAVTAPAALALRWEVPHSVLSPAAGRVQEVLVAPGDVLENGTEMLLVNNRTIVAFAAEVPFFRPLSYLDDGSDAAALNEMLATMGLESSPGDVVTARTVRGIKALDHRLGGGRGGGTFDPTWIAFLPSDGETVESVHTGVGDAVAIDAEIVGLRPSVESATLVDAESAPHADDGSLEAGSAAGNGRADDSMATAMPIPPDSHVELPDGTKLDIDDSGNVTDASIGAVTSASQPGDVSTAVRIVTPPSVGSVLAPAGAIYVDTRGNQCMIRATAAQGGSTTPVRVTITGYTLGGVAVRSGDLSEGTWVVSRPGQTDRVTC
ncbi:hypothetical protein [Pseudactinotalea sp. HY160]|uniref:hypothetical protein n=1 Tax=Pseudactinotalea sp. HY160 TaxID=2654490 RepID=UPI0018838833|nr:hypothetical protein [Pseudactinotalea sp. HY160]